MYRVTWSVQEVVNMVAMREWVWLCVPPTTHRHANSSIPTFIQTHLGFVLLWLLWLLSCDCIQFSHILVPNKHLHWARHNIPHTHTHTMVSSQCPRKEQPSCQLTSHPVAFWSWQADYTHTLLWPSCSLLFGLPVCVCVCVCEDEGGDKCIYTMSVDYIALQV